MQGVWLTSYLILWVSVVALWLIVLLMLRQLGLQYLNTTDAASRDGPAIGSPAPQFAAEDIHSREHSVGIPGPNTLLIFGSPTCRPCRGLVPDLNRFAEENAESVRVLFVSGGMYEASVRFVEETSLAVPVLAGGGDTVGSVYKVRVTPLVSS